MMCHIPVLWQGTPWAITPENGTKHVEKNALVVGESIDDDCSVTVLWLKSFSLTYTLLSSADFDVNYSSGKIYLSDSIFQEAKNTADEFVISYRHNNDDKEVTVYNIQEGITDIMEEDSKNHQEKLQGMAIRSVAALYRLFREITHPDDHYQLRGTLTDSAGNSASGCVYAYEISGANPGNHDGDYPVCDVYGVYSMQLFPGTYKVYARVKIPYPSGTLYFYTPYQDITIEGDNTLNIQLQPYQLRHITGKVTNTSGVGIGNVSININGSNGIYSYTYTASDGSYDAYVLGGTYTLHFAPPYNSSYVAEIINNYQVSGDAIKNITMQEQYTISGSIKDQYESPVYGYIYLNKGSFYDYVWTNSSNGTYQRGLPSSGNYYLSAYEYKNYSNNGYGNFSIGSKSISIAGSTVF